MFRDFPKYGTICLGVVKTPSIIPTFGVYGTQLSMEKYSPVLHCYMQALIPPYMVGAANHNARGLEYPYNLVVCGTLRNRILGISNRKCYSVGLNAKSYKALPMLDSVTERMSGMVVPGWTVVVVPTGIVSPTVKCWSVI
jgi:hypothetical protein